MIPNLFSKKPIPGELPSGMDRAIASLKRCKSKRQCLKKAYHMLGRKYRGYMILTYLRLPEVFRYDPHILWQKKGFLHCTNMNYLLRILLIKSKLFSEQDIRLKISWVRHVSIHQYLQVQVSKGEWVNVDLWSKAHGIPLGDYAHGFNT